MQYLRKQQLENYYAKLIEQLYSGPQKKKTIKPADCLLDWEQFVEFDPNNFPIISTPFQHLFIEKKNEKINTVLTRLSQCLPAIAP